MSWASNSALKASNRVVVLLVVVRGGFSLNFSESKGASSEVAERDALGKRAEKQETITAESEATYVGSSPGLRRGIFMLHAELGGFCSAAIVSSAFLAPSTCINQLP